MDTTEMIDPVTGGIIDEQQLAEQLLKQAREQSVDLLGPDGLLNGLTKRVLETALDAEMTEHLGREKHQPADGGNIRNGTRSKTVLTEVGPVQIDVPRDRDGSFDPKIVRKRRRRLTGVDEIVLSLTARGLTTGEVAAHFDDVYGASVSKDTISRITDKVIEEMTDWQNRPLDRVDDWGLGVLLAEGRIRKMTSSHVGENKEFERQYLSGELELELTPQGTLAEKLRAGGAGIAAFFTQTGAGTQVAEGGLPQKYAADGSIAVASKPKPVQTFTVRGEEADFALVHALKGDRHGNLVFDKSARNFSPLAAMAGRVCIAQVEELVEPGEIDADAVHLPGIFVDRVVEVGTGIEKRIERRTVSVERAASREMPEGA